MTSELKPCPFCGGKATLKMAYETPRSKEGQTDDEEYVAFVDCSSCSEDLFFIRAFSNSPEKAQEAAAKAWNTRAVPDVPELVRWKHCEYPNQHKMMEHTEGEYVLHSQAAEIIAAEQQKTKDAEELAFRMDRFAQKYLRHLNNEKQISEQKSKDWFAFCELIGVDIDSHEAIADKIIATIQDAEAAEAKIAQYEAQVTAPAADLKADLERKDAALRFYADTSKYPAPLTGGMGALWGDCGQIARAALNVEASNEPVINR